MERNIGHCFVIYHNSVSKSCYVGMLHDMLGENSLIFIRITKMKNLYIYIYSMRLINLQIGQRYTTCTFVIIGLIVGMLDTRYLVYIIRSVYLGVGLCVHERFRWPRTGYAHTNKNIASSHNRTQPVPFMYNCSREIAHIFICASDTFIIAVMFVVMV